MAIDLFYNKLITILTRSFSQWYLDGDTLAYFMCNYTLDGCKWIIISAVGSLEVFDQIIERSGFIKTGRGRCSSVGGIEIEIRLKKEIPAILEEYPIDWERYPLRFPTNIGDVLDNNNIRWTEDTPRFPKPEHDNVFFDKRRRQEGYDFIEKMLQCGEKAGIRGQMFLAFGGLLGYALRHDFMPKDHDIDMCIMADGIPQEQRHQYLMACKDAGLTENRFRGPFSVDGKYAWFSIGPKSIEQQHGVKSCNWFWFKHGGYWWHSKGKRWIGRAGLSDKYATAKGIPSDIFTGDMKKINFGGNEIWAPRFTGKCLDWWYRDWLHRRGGSSYINAVLVIPKEDDQSTWYIINR